ncbi:MAG TPA: hypothetical protein VI977_02005 [archaeon]|nr:hypothetical protein [archaeon]
MKKTMLLIMAFAVLLLSASAFAAFAIGYQHISTPRDRYVVPPISPAGNVSYWTRIQISKAQPPALQNPALHVIVTGTGNPKNVSGTVFAQLGFGPGGQRGTASSGNGELVFQNLSPNKYYSVLLRGNGRSTWHYFVFVGNSDTYKTLFV